MQLMWIFFLSTIASPLPSLFDNIPSAVVEQKIMSNLKFREAYKMMRELHSNPLMACQMNPIENHNAHQE
jgi:hypothetical protein